MKKIAKILRTLCLVTVLGVAAVSLTACDEEEAIDAAHTITFYNTMGTALQEPLKASIKEFEEKFPGWTVKAPQIGGYDEVRSSVITDLQAGTQPDLAYCYADHVAQYLVTGKVVNMNKYINNTGNLTVNVLTNAETGEWGSKTYGTIGYSAEEIADFVPGYYAEGYASNYANYEKYGYAATDMLTLPFQKSTEVLYYNADALIELGYYEEITVEGVATPVKVATPPETWDELWEICASAVERGKTDPRWSKVTPLGYDSESNWFITMCEQNGWGYTSADSSNHYLFNNENTQAWLTQLAEYYELGYFTTQEVYGSYSSNLFVKGIEEGGTIFSIGSSGGASYQATEKFTWGVAPLPGSKVGNEVNYAAISQGPSLVMFDTSAENAAEKQLMTWEYVKILLSPDYQYKFAGVSGYMPARLSTYDIPDYIKDLNKEGSITAATCLVAKGMTDRYFTSPAFVGSSTARDQVGVALRYVITGSKSAASALAEAERKCGA